MLMSVSLHDVHPQAVLRQVIEEKITSVPVATEIVYCKVILWVWIQCFLQHYWIIVSFFRNWLVYCKNDIKRVFVFNNIQHTRMYHKGRI